LRQLISLDPFGLTQFELSFKVNKDIEKGKLRILNLDGEAYSYASKESYLKRLNEYYSLVKKHNSNPFLVKLFHSLKSIANNPLDVYIGADIERNKHLFAFWLIFGGVQKNGKINFNRDCNRMMGQIFDNLKIKPNFKITKDILNLGFDIDDKSFFYKIYYFLNKDNHKFLSKNEKSKISRITDFLGDKYRYWFFISERFKIGKKELNRKKIYLEFLDDIKMEDDKTFDLIRDLFKIINCKYNIERLKSILKNINGKVVIFAFENNGTVTFYLRI
jgi:hypothetical protein